MLRLQARFVAAAISVLFCGKALGQTTITWIGDADTTNWSDTNWSPAPDGLGTYNAVFDLDYFSDGQLHSTVDQADQINSVTISGSNTNGMLLDGPGPLTLVSYLQDSSPSTVTISVPIAGNGAYVQENGGGTLILTGVNTYTGGTSVTNSSQLVIGTSSTGGSDSNVTSGPVGTGTLMLGSGTNLAVLNGDSYTLGNTITLCGSGTAYLFGNSNGSTLTLSGTISGGAALEIVAPDEGGTNYVTFTSPNSTFSGGLNVDSGGTSLRVGASSTGPAGAPTSGPFGTGTVMLSDGNDFSTVDSSCYTIANNFTLCGGGTVYLFQTNNSDAMLTLTGMISGSSRLYVGYSDDEYSNTLSLTSGCSTFSGGISVQPGYNSIRVGASSWGSPDDVSSGPLGTGTLMLSNDNDLSTVDSSCYTIGNSITLCGTGTSSLFETNSSNAMLTLSGTISGSGTLLVSNGGYTNYLGLTSPYSAFTGGVQVESGATTLAVGASSSSEGSVYEGPLGTGTLMLSSGNSFTTVDSNCYTIGNDITLCGGGTVYLLSGTSTDTMLTLTGMISGSSALEVGGNDYYNYLALTSGCSTFSGGVNVESGTTLAVGASSTVSDSSITQGPLGTGTLMLSNGSSFTTVDSNCYTIDNAITLCGGGTVYLLSGSNTDTMLTLTGMISGASALDVGGNDYNNYLALTSGCSTFSGGVSVESGTTLAVGASSTASDGIVSKGPLGTGTLMLGDGSTFTTTGSGSYTIDNAITLCGGGTVTLLGGSMGTMLTLNGPISGSSTLEVSAPGCSGSSTLTLTNPSSAFSGGVIVDPGSTTLVVGASGLGTAASITSSPLGTGTLVLGSGNTLTTPSGTPITVLNAIQLCGCVNLGGSSSGTLTLLGTISDYVSPGMLVIDGPADLEGANTFSGGTTVNEATVTVGTNSGLGTGSVTLNASTINFTATSPTLSDLSLGTGSTINFAAGSTPSIVDMSSDTSGSGNSINLGSGPGSTQLTVQVDSDPDYYGTITGKGSLVVTTASSGTLDLFGANTYNGGTTVGAPAGDHTLLVASNATALGTGPVTLNSGGILGLDNGVTITNQVAVNNGASIGGYGTVAPASPETITIASGSGITGGRGSFIGNGDVNHPVVGTLSFGSNASLVFGGGGGMQFSIMNASGTPGTDFSQVDVSGSLNITATSGDPFNIQLVGVDSTGQLVGTANTFNAGQSYQWTLLAATGGITGFNPSAFNVDSWTYFSNSTGVGVFSVSVIGNDLTLNFTPVPEPSTWALMASGICALGAAVRRRRS
jgi:hypothetical protein